MASSPKITLKETPEDSALRFQAALVSHQVHKGNQSLMKLDEQGSLAIWMKKTRRQGRNRYPGEGEAAGHVAGDFRPGFRCLVYLS